MAERKSSAELGKKELAKPGNGNQRGALTHPQSRSMTTPYFASLGRLRSEFDRLFDDVFHGWPAFGGERADSDEVEVQDRENEIVIRADAPGFEPEDFEVEIRGDNLVLCACQKEEQSSEASGYRWQEREMYRSIPLSADIDADKVDATYHSGVLTITLPKSEPAKTRKIQIRR